MMRAGRLLGGVTVLAAVAMIVACSCVAAFARRSPFSAPVARAGDPAAVLAQGRWEVLARSPIGAPAGASVTWDGSALLLVGGGADGSSAQSRSAASFDPVNDLWSRIAPVPSNVLAVDATTVWTGTRLFVLGGTGPKGSRVTGIAGLLDPYTDRWTTTPPAPVTLPNSSLTAVSSHGRVVLAAANYQHGTLQTAEYDPAKDRWSSLPLTLPTGHAPLAVEMVATGDGVLLWSMWSRNQRNSPTTFTTFSGVDVYRLIDGQWRPATGAWPQHRTVDQPLLAGSQVLLGASQIWCGTCAPPITTDTNGWSVDPKTLAIAKLPHGPLDDLEPQILWTQSTEIALNNSGEREGPSEKVLPGDIAFLDPAIRRWFEGPRAPQTLGEPSAIWDGTHLLALGQRGGVLSYGPAVTGRVILDDVRVQPGGIIHGKVVFENHTPDTVVMMSGCAVNGLFTIGFRNAQGESQGTAFTTVGCLHQQHLVARPGTTVYPFKLRASYTVCNGSAKEQQPETSPYWSPLCGKDAKGKRDVMPSLPTGTYTAFFSPETQWEGPTVVPAKLIVAQPA